MKSDQELIDQHIREKGVTKCPPAMAVETQVDLPEAAKAAHAARGPDPVGDAWRAARRPGRPKAAKAAEPPPSPVVVLPEPEGAPVATQSDDEPGWCWCGRWADHKGHCTIREPRR